MAEKLTFDYQWQEVEILKFGVTLVCGKCVKEVAPKGPYGLQDVTMVAEFSEGVGFAHCPRGHDTKVELHYVVKEE